MKTGSVPTKELRGEDISPQAEASFWSLVRINFAKTQCWEWIGGSLQNGYPRFQLGRGNKYAAGRVAYAIAYGNVPRGLFVCHHCDNTLCVRPDHLFLGTAGDNAADKIRKGRQPVGERGGGAKLTAAQVLEIRADKRTRQEIADEYGISLSNVKRIRARDSWAHLLDRQT